MQTQQHNRPPLGGQDSQEFAAGFVQVPALELKSIARELTSLRSLVGGLIRQVDTVEDNVRILPDRALKAIEPVKSRLLDVETRIDNALNIASGFQAV